MPMHITSMKIDDEVWVKLKIIAAKKHMKLHDIVSSAVLDWIKKNK